MTDVRQLGLPVRKWVPDWLGLVTTFSVILPVILLKPGALPTGDMTVLETPGQRVIPFSSAAGSDILIGFRPERITLKTLTKPKDIQAYLAFDKAGNSFAGTDGLFPASLL